MIDEAFHWVYVKMNKNDKEAIPNEIIKLNEFDKKFENKSIEIHFYYFTLTCLSEENN
jgi:hypothetical protein